MATITITVAVIAGGGTPFTATELAEVTSYLRTPLGDLGLSFEGGMDFRLVSADEVSLTFRGDGEFL